MLARKMFDERVVTCVLRDDVKEASGIGSHGAADVVSKDEIECVFAAGGEAYQVHRCSVFEEFFDKGNIELRLFGAQQQR